jgi:hypothetical protein
MFLTDEHYLIAEQNGISKRNVYQRWYYYGYDIQRAITEPLKTCSNVWSEWKEVCKSNGISNDCFNMRIKKGMPPEEAATMPKQWKKGEVK